MILARLVLQLWVVAFVGFFGSSLSDAYPGIRIATQLLFVAPLVAWAALRLRGPRTTLDWAILLALAATLVVSLTSADRQGSLESLGLALAYALAFWAARDLGGSTRIRAAVAVSVTYALVFWLVMTAIWWIAEKVAWVQAFGTMPNLESHQVFIWSTANVLPALSLLAIPFLRWQTPGLPRRILAILWAAASVVVVPLSAGRAGWLGMAVAAVAYEGLAGWPRVRHSASWIRERRLLVAAEAAGVLAVLGAAGILVARGQTLVIDNLNDRFQIWSQALGIFASNPLTGGGPSTYSWLRLTHNPDYTFSPGVRLAHDVPMLTLADGGMVLAGAFTILVGVFLATAWRQRSDPRRRTALAVLIGYAATSLLDDFSILPAVITLVIVLAAWTVAPSQADLSMRAHEPRRWRPFAMPMVLLALGIAVLPSVVGVDAARAVASGARSSSVAGNWSAAVEEFTQATRDYGTDAGYWLGLGLARWELGDAAGSTAAYQRARELSPGDPRSYGALAALTNDAGERIRLLETAAKMTMTDPQYAFRLGDALWAAGRHEDAVNAYALAVTIDSQLASAFTTGTRPQLAAIAPVAEATAAGLGDRDIYIHPEWVRWDIGLVEGQLPADAWPSWHAVELAARGDLFAARAAAGEAEREIPFEEHTVNALLYVTVRSCDSTEYQRIASYIGPYVQHRPSGVVEVREHTYRENSLGTYQPLSVSPLPQDERWPVPLVGAPPACPGWSPAP